VETGVLKNLLIGSIPAIILGSLLINFLKGAYGLGYLNLLASILIGAILVTISVRYLLKGKGKVRDDSHPIRAGRKAKSSWGILAGFIVGFLFQLTSIGAGSLLIPYLMTVLRSNKRIVGTTILYGLTVSSLSTLLHYNLGTVNHQIVLPLIMGAFPGLFIGVKIGDHIRLRSLHTILYVLILASGLSILIKAFL
jgi:uncharacterized membrane protein YfcA